MISKWLEQAKRGQTVWLPDVREGCARMEDAVPVTMQLTLCGGSKRDFSLPLPRWQNEQGRQFVKQYVTACVYNTLSACSGREMAFYLDARESEAAALLGQLDEVFQVRRTARSGYGKVINIAGCAAPSAADASPSRCARRRTAPPPWMPHRYRDS